MWYSSIGILSLLVLVIINFDVFKRNTEGDHVPSQTSYRWFLLAVGVYLITDALWGILYEQHLIGILYVDTVLYFLAMAAVVLLWTRYVVTYLRRTGIFRSLLTWAGWLFFSLQFAFLFINCFVPIHFWFDEEGVYHAGWARYFALGVQILIFLLTMLYSTVVTAKSKGRGKQRHLTITLFSVAMGVMTVAQIYDPLLPLYAIGLLLGICILHTFVLEDEKASRRKELEELLLREQEQRKELGSAKAMAYTDSLTGVKNKHAYVEAEAEIDRRIAGKELQHFAIVVFDLNALKQVNDTEGHEAGDEYIQSGCELICREFKHSPVFRIGGDEFVALLEGEDYENRYELLHKFDSRVEENLLNGKVVVASGLENFKAGQDDCLNTVFKRADQKMYVRKRVLKGAITRRGAKETAKAAEDQA